MVFFWWTKYLPFTKFASYLAPWLLKLALNSLVAGTANPMILTSYFSTFFVSQMLKTFFDGKRIEVNGQITRLAFLDISFRVYRSLLGLDL